MNWKDAMQANFQIHEQVNAMKAVLKMVILPSPQQVANVAELLLKERRLNSCSNVC